MMLLKIRENSTGSTELGTTLFTPNILKQLITTLIRYFQEEQFATSWCV